MGWEVWKIQSPCILGIYVQVRENDEVYTTVRTGSELLTLLAVGTRGQAKLYTWVFVTSFIAEHHPMLAGGDNG